MRLASELNQEGHRVIVSALSHKPSFKACRRQLLSSHMVRSWSAGGASHGIGLEPIRWMKLAAAVRRDPPDIICSLQPRTYRAAKLLGWLFPKIQTVFLMGKATTSRPILTQKAGQRKKRMESRGLKRRLSEQIQRLQIENTDLLTVKRFGHEWERFSQPDKYLSELYLVWKEYFRIFPQRIFRPQAIGCDFGSGSGRWARFVAPLVKRLFCIDASPKATGVALKNLKGLKNVDIKTASLTTNPIPKNSLDFGYCLGVLHHVPRPSMALEMCVQKLKRGAPLLIYIYQSINNRPLFFRLIFQIVDKLRRIICRFPEPWLARVCDVIALGVYYPMARVSHLAEKLNLPFENIPLCFYRNLSFYTMRTDARDRFGTPMEHRFTRNQIAQMMDRSGFVNIRFSEQMPFWCVVGVKR